MKRTVLAGLSTLIAFGVSAQNARLVLANNAFMTFGYTAPTTNTYLVIANPDPNAITVTGTGGNIVTENERNRVRWLNDGTTPASAYTVPLTSRAGDKIPVTVQKNNNGVATSTSSIVFSTYNWQAATAGASWDNSFYQPTDVVHMNSNIDGSPNSGNVIDRFWIIDAGQPGFGYTTKPNVTISMGFRNADITAGNTAGLAGVLQPQRFNSTLGQWADWFPSGTLDPGVSMDGIAVPAANFFRSWTLASSLIPLPIELLSWSGKCEGDKVVLSWVTASEKDNEYFSIERSADGENWDIIGTVPGALNSNSMLNYSFEDRAPVGLAYYRLRQTDIDGTNTVSAIVPAGCTAPNGIEIVSAWDDGSDLNVQVSSTFDGLYELTLLDVQGKIMAARPSQVINKGYTLLKLDRTSIATGVYMLRLHDLNNVMARRVFVN